MYFFSPIDALAVCETTAITLAIIEQAKNLGFGIWLITSANADFSFRESSSLATSTSSRSFAGCHICIITLACGSVSYDQTLPHIQPIRQLSCDYLCRIRLNH